MQHFFCSGIPWKSGPANNFFCFTLGPKNKPPVHQQQLIFVSLIVALVGAKARPAASTVV